MNQNDEDDEFIQTITADRLNAMRRAYEESDKLLYDFFKHITTISTGSILIMLALLEKLFNNPTWKFLVAIAFGGFVLSILASLFMMFTVCHGVRDSETNAFSSQLEISFVVGFYLTAISFLVGIICLVIFSIRNLYL